MLNREINYISSSQKDILIFSTDSCGNDLAVIVNNTSPEFVIDFETILPDILCGKLAVISGESGKVPTDIQALIYHRRFGDDL